MRNLIVLEPLAHARPDLVHTLLNAVEHAHDVLERLDLELRRPRRQPHVLTGHSVDKLIEIRLRPLEKLRAYRPTEVVEQGREPVGGTRGLENQRIISHNPVNEPYNLSRNTIQALSVNTPAAALLVHAAHPARHSLLDPLGNSTVPVVDLPPQPGKQPQPLLRIADKVSTQLPVRRVQ